MLLTKDESKYCKCISNMTNIWINPKADDTVLLVYALLFCNFFLPFFPLRKVCIMNRYRGVTKGCPTILRIHILNPDPAKNLNLDPDSRNCHIYNVDITFWPFLIWIRIRDTVILTTLTLLFSSMPRSRVKWRRRASRRSGVTRLTVVEQEEVHLFHHCPVSKSGGGGDKLWNNAKIESKNRQ